MLLLMLMLLSSQQKSFVLIFFVFSLRSTDIFETESTPFQQVPSISILMDLKSQSPSEQKIIAKYSSNTLPLVSFVLNNLTKANLPWTVDNDSTPELTLLPSG
jgi:hypothetical protein